MADEKLTWEARAWTLIQEAMQAFGPFYREEMQGAIQEWEVPDNWFALTLARGGDPAPLGVERLQAMNPYTSREGHLDRLEELARLELLERVGPEAYRLTDQGREAVEDIYRAAHQGMAPLEPLPPEEMGRLSDMLQRLVEATLEGDEPEEKWAIIYSRWTDPGEDAPAAVRIDQYLTDLLRFRDDAHLAAWRPLDVSGPAWEALTFVWRDDAHTAEELVEKLPYRTHPAEVYKQALADLAARGWVIQEAGAYKLVDEGKRVREKAEEATDRYFFASWAYLNEGERAELLDLLTRLRDNLRKAAENDQ